MRHRHCHRNRARTSILEPSRLRNPSGGPRGRLRHLHRHRQPRTRATRSRTTPRTTRSAPGPLVDAGGPCAQSPSTPRPSAPPSCNLARSWTGVPRPPVGTTGPGLAQTERQPRIPSPSRRRPGLHLHASVRALPPSPGASPCHVHVRRCGSESIPAGAPTSRSRRNPTRPPMLLQTTLRPTPPTATRATRYSSATRATAPGHYLQGPTLQAVRPPRRSVVYPYRSDLGRLPDVVYAITTTRDWPLDYAPGRLRRGDRQFTTADHERRVTSGRCASPDGRWRRNNWWEASPTTFGLTNTQAAIRGQSSPEALLYHKSPQQ